jgi:2-polyprenyl-6-methoxyphenol hydroxylase-like FAD-dependent oxidoreductase
MAHGTIRKVLIIGGGIGGLATTLALRQAGFDVQVFESVPEIRVVGAGLALWSNALDAMQRIGLAEAIQAVSRPAAYRIIRTASGELLTKVDINQMGNGLSSPLVHMHRGDLQIVLLQAVGIATIQQGARCVGFRQDSKGVWAQFADGHEVHGDLLVGADGVHSVIRQQLFSEARLRFVGQSSLRGIAQISSTQLAEDMASETWGFGQRIGLFPLSHGRVYWFFTLNAARRDKIQGTAAERKQQIQEILKDWHDPIPSIIQATEAETIIDTNLNELAPLGQWHSGRVVLLGDAAHAMTPNLGQGACQALEDAVTLGQCLQEEDDVEAALNRYESKRVERARRVIEYSRRFGEVAHDETAPACQLRNGSFDAIFRSIYVEPIEWILQP